MSISESPLRQRGKAMRRKLVGETYADQLDKDLYQDPVMEKFAELTQEVVFGTIWYREGLDLKARTLVTFVSDAATGRIDELKVHTRFALNHGWTKDELVEVLLHLLGYIGTPLVRESLIAANEVFHEIMGDPSEPVAL
jgi:4-carboxymuconolactone decarboxylase